MLYPVRNQVYKLEFSKKWRIYDVFHMSLLEQNTTRKGRVDKNTTKVEYKAGKNKNKEYKVEGIWDSAVYARESD